MDTVYLYDALEAAKKLLEQARYKTGIGNPAWDKLYNASKYLTSQQVALLADELEDK
jgi:hypothetical protein